MTQQEKKFVLEKFLDYYYHYSKSQKFFLHVKDARLMFKHNALAQKEIDKNEKLKKNYLKSFEKMKNYYHRRRSQNQDDPEALEYLRIAERFETAFWPFVYLNFSLCIAPLALG